MSQLAQLYIVALTLLLKNLCWLWISFGVKAKVLNKAWKVPELALGCFFSVWSILFQMSPWFTLAQWSSLGNYFSLSLFFYLTLFFSIMTTWYLFSWLHLLRCKLNRILYFSILAAWNKVCYMVGAQGLLGVEINDLPILTTTLRGSLGTFFFLNVRILSLEQCTKSLSDWLPKSLLLLLLPTAFLNLEKATWFTRFLRVWNDQQQALTGHAPRVHKYRTKDFHLAQMARLFPSLAMWVYAAYSLGNQPRIIIISLGQGYISITFAILEEILIWTCTSSHCSPCCKLCSLSISRWIPKSNKGRHR